MESISDGKTTLKYDNDCTIFVEDKNEGDAFWEFDSVDYTKAKWDEIKKIFSKGEKSCFYQTLFEIADYVCGNTSSMKHLVAWP